MRIKNINKFNVGPIAAGLHVAGLNTLAISYLAINGGFQIGSMIDPFIYGMRDEEVLDE